MKAAVKTLAEYQALATQVPPSLRNNRDRILFPVTGLQAEAGKIGSLLMSAPTPRKSALTVEQAGEARDCLSEVLWYVALLCHETGITMEEVAAYSVTQLQARAKELDPDQR